MYRDDSNAEVGIGPVTTKKRRRMIVREIQEEYESGQTIADWTNRHLFLNGSHTILCCPSYRLIHNVRGRFRTRDLYCANFSQTAQAFKLPATCALRIRNLLDMKAPNGDLTHTREHLHRYSLHGQSYGAA